MSKYTIDLPILESIKDAQMQHGLKYDNYRNYRSYCSRRLHRIRRSLNVAQGVATSAKARHQRAKKLNDVTNQMILEAGEKDKEYAERLLIIPLYLAERAWSYAMQLKQDVADQPRKRFHLVRRLLKAAKYATKFEQLCLEDESLCERTKQEATAYACYINGLYKLERENWADAKEDLNKALKIYFTLSLSITKKEVLEHYQQRIEELRASLKFCDFNLGAKDKSITVKLPQTLQFHDIAFKHAHSIQQELVAQTVSEEMKEVEGEAKEAEEPEDPEVFEDPENAGVEEEEEEQEEEEEEDDDSSDDDEQQTQPGGVTGLVKGWLGL